MERPDPSGPVPRVLPIFPLTGSLLLPGTYLPLNIFETRYRNMVRDALDGQRTLGMVQPRRPGPDNLGLVAAEERPEIYSVGCAGWIRECEPQPDGRFHIVLQGLVRFRVLEELEVRHGYRRVRIDCGEFERQDGEGEPVAGTRRLIAAVERYGELRGLEFDRDVLLSLPGSRLINALCAALPFEPVEKQALLEAPTASERRELLLALLGMGLAERPPDDLAAPPTVH